MHSQLTRFLGGRLLVCAGLLGLSLTLTGHVRHVDAQEETGFLTSKSKVKVVLRASGVDAAGRQMLVFDVEIAKDWYIYANPVGSRLLANNATKVTIDGAPKPMSVRVVYPSGEAVQDGEYNYRIYKQKAQIKAYVQRSPGTGPLDVALQVNACKKSKDGKYGKCLPPGTISYKVK